MQAWWIRREAAKEKSPEERQVGVVLEVRISEGRVVYTFTNEKDTVVRREGDYGLLVRLELRLDFALRN